jgi:hypothetical protein
MTKLHVEDAETEYIPAINISKVPDCIDGLTTGEEKSGRSSTNKELTNGV